MMIMSARDSTLFTLNAVGTVIWQAADGETRWPRSWSAKSAPSLTSSRSEAMQDAESFVARSGQPRHSAGFGAADQPAAVGAGRCPMSLMQEMGQRALDRGVPLSVQLDVTYRCNERCVHCYLDHDDHGEMTTAEINDVLDQLAEAGVFFLTFSGGEVFMRMDFFEIVEYARSLMFCVKIKTNAFMIRESEADRIARSGRAGRAGQHLFAPAGGARRDHHAARIAEAIGRGHPAAASARREGDHRQRADAAEFAAITPASRRWPRRWAPSTPSIRRSRR